VHGSGGARLNPLVRVAEADPDVARMRFAAGALALILICAGTAGSARAQEAPQEEEAVPPSAPQAEAQRAPAGGDEGWDEGLARARQRGAARLERALLALRRRVPERWRPKLHRFEDFAEAQGRALAVAAAGALALLLFVRGIWLRPGDLSVSIEYPAELRGTFSVWLARRPPAPGRAVRTRSTRRASRTERHLVARETRFDALAPGNYWIQIEGTLEDPSRTSVLRQVSETQRVRVSRNRTFRVEFDLRPRGCPLEIRIRWDGRAVEQACAAALGQPDSLRYARQGVARLELPLGRHRIAVGSGDRVAELDVELHSHRTQTVEVELGGSGELLFRGCPPAVSPYVEGDLPGAAQALEREGQADLARRLLERLQESRALATDGNSDKPDDGAEEQPRLELADAGQSRYDILEQIGRGGMGVVFKARDRRLGRLVALKQLPENLREHPTAIQLFLREARAAAALNHPNIVTLYDADEENGKFFLTMELLEGQPLNQILRLEERLSVHRTCRLGVQIAAGLHYAHEKRIVHRDVKTGNLFWTRDKLIKIMDFGLSKMLEEVRKSTTVVGGTPYYVAPEQIEGSDVDARADLYAFGITLFELLTGNVPFREGDVLFHHRNTPAPDPRERVAGLPGALVELIRALLEKDAARRPQSAAEVGSRLGEIDASL
jgi:tRNA A-37 threonylcarbamoyl transferase component Bud32